MGGMEDFIVGEGFVFTFRCALCYRPTTRGRKKGKLCNNNNNIIIIMSLYIVVVPFVLLLRFRMNRKDNSVEKEYFRIIF